ncbi:AAA family ATPase [Geotalea toluenoxydans]|uniref:AAA family ATPase n=1 Tax=Geotalea toluenoxydans TaxID=421624 RepID=UPI000A9BF6C0
MADNIVGYIFAIIAATRDHPLVLSGISTRGGINLADAARSVAYLEGRNFVIPEDVKEIVVAVGSHRLITKEESQSLDKEELLRSIVKKIPVPLS